MSESDNGRIAKNTLYLYIRMAVMMVVRLYTVRVVLETLGVSDYGIWTAVTALVSAFTVVNPTLVSATQRFLTYDMGRGSRRLTEIFSIAFFFFLAMGLVVTLALESGGLWFLKCRMQVPQGMEGQAVVVFQFCIATLLVDMVRMPYESAIVAAEKMRFYAVVCLLEAFVLLGIVFLLPLFGSGRLAAYGALTFGAQGVICLAYVLYSRRKFGFARIHRPHDRQLAREMASFCGWNVFGSLASMTAIQGLNLLMNVYFGVDVNAAYGISLQAHAALWITVVNLSKAATPRITKDYASGQLEEMRALVTGMSKASYFLMLLMAVPMVLNINELLRLWLGAKLPPLAPLFCVLTVVQTLIAALSIIPDSVNMATGRIRNYQFAVSALVFLTIGVSWVLFACGLAPMWALIVKCGVEILILLARMWYQQRLAGVRAGMFTMQTLLPSLTVTVIAVGATSAVTSRLPVEGALARLFATTGIWILFYLPSVWFIGLTAPQRSALLAKLKH